MKKLTLILASGMLMSNLALAAIASRSVSDDEINSKITSIIEGKKLFPNVIATTKEGNVTLTGTVTSQQEFQDAESIVRKAIDGLKDINGNNVQLTNAIQILNNV